MVPAMIAVFLRPIALLLLLVTGAFSSNLDKESIKELYFDGEFKAVAEGLESFLETEEDLSDEDRIFAYKYLSVVHAANPDTRKKAEQGYKAHPYHPFNLEKLKGCRFAKGDLD